ncbi:IMPACT family protein [Oceanivirga salmonicida]|uniref:IMPACT family protein n=1 Tax=Oceanivirga salmonicida TaxID=1769291 RepID=UPI00083663C8|nr:YigZ family protein [Oceanivirga salmonicida]
MDIVVGSTKIEFIEKKSKFIGYIKGVKTKQEAIDFIEHIKEKHKDATHNVPVYRIVENGQEYFKYDDDGEPQNTAAKPMADIFERKKIYNFAIVATRYFGGIKLGAGGLIRNYARVAKELFEVCKIEEYIEKYTVIINFDYTKQNIVDKIINDENIEIIEKSYLEKINFKLKLTKKQIKKFENIKNVDIIRL